MAGFAGYFPAEVLAAFRLPAGLQLGPLHPRPPQQNAAGAAAVPAALLQAVPARQPLQQPARNPTMILCL